MTNIAHYRRLRGLNQEQLGQKVGISQPHVSRIEKGDDGPPLRLFRDIAIALNVSLADLFSEQMDQAILILADAYRTAPEGTRRVMAAMAHEIATQDDRAAQSGQSSDHVSKARGSQRSPDHP